MRIAYLLHWARGAPSGVTRKVIGQVTTWRRLGASVSVVAYGRPSVSGFARALAEAGVPVHARAFTTWWGRSAAIADCVAHVRASRPDVTYFRQDLWHPAIERIAQELPLVLEVNTDDVAEVSLGRLHQRVFHLATRDRMLRSAAGVVFVSGELARSPRFDAAPTQRLVLGNGIDLDAHPVLPPSQHPAPGLVFMVGEAQPWHGVEKVMWLAGQRPDWRFHHIGEVAPRGRGDAPPNVTFHGLLAPPAIEAVLRDCDIGIGSLALHRLNIGEISPLKTRAYLAAGLPVILGYTDTDFPDGAPFLLQLANEESNVRDGLARIDAFVAAWKGRRVERPAVGRLDLGVKEERRLEFLRRVAGC